VEEDRRIAAAETIMEAGIMVAGMTGGSMTSTSNNSNRDTNGDTRAIVAAEVVVDGRVVVVGVVSIASVIGVAPRHDIMINAVGIIETMTTRSGQVWRSAKVIFRINANTNTTVIIITTKTAITAITTGPRTTTAISTTINKTRQRQRLWCATYLNPSRAR